MTYKHIALAVAGVLAIAMIAPAHAMNLINEDDQAYEVTVVEAEGDGNATSLMIDAGATIGDVCVNTCTLRMENGAELTVESDVDVVIQDGTFVLAE
jgi:hypothetical protein